MEWLGWLLAESFGFAAVDRLLLLKKGKPNMNCEPSFPSVETTYCLSRRKERKVKEIGIGLTQKSTQWMRVRPVCTGAFPDVLSG
jgi:hypothetical protein